MTTKEQIDYLVKNKAELIQLKKDKVKACDIISISQSIGKASTSYSESNEIQKTIIGNTYNWMDSHDDVHIEGIFSKSLNENKNILFLHDHEWKLTSKVGIFEKVYEEKIDWTQLGINIIGQTTALKADAIIKKEYNPLIFDQYKTGQINQHSVGMIYIKLFLAVNDQEYKEEYANWMQYFPVIANGQKAWDKGYFWAVTEAKLKEISCVIEGSNELTPTLEPSKGTLIYDEPQLSTHEWGKLINDFKL